ncbi:ferritin family protein [Planctomycetota bacterium]
MDKFESVDDILEFAITGEVAANQFYMELAGKMENPAMAKAFEDLAKEELGHKAKLEAIKQDKTLEPMEKVTDLKLADYLVGVEPQPDMNYQNALILAMKKEKVAYKLYTHLAGVAGDKNLTEMFLRFAQEEAKHKLLLEIEYDEVVLKEN